MASTVSFNLSLRIKQILVELKLARSYGGYLYSTYINGDSMTTPSSKTQKLLHHIKGTDNDFTTLTRLH